MTVMEDLYTILPSPGEGLGCFATTDIQAGSLLLTERPLFAVLEPRDDFAVVNAFSNLTAVGKEQYLTLHAVNPESHGDARVNDIFNSNAWQTGPRTSILLKAARFNHSCVPNATLAWNSQLSCVTVYSIVDIGMHSQIFLSYLRPYLNLAARREKLARYGFVCMCNACTINSGASEIRRKRMIALDAKVRIARRRKWKTEAPKEALALVGLLKEEGIVGEALGLAYHDVALGWRNCARLDLAKKYAMKEFDVAVSCYGSDSPNVDSTRELLRSFEDRA